MIEQENRQRNVERSLFNLQRRLVCNGLEGLLLTLEMPIRQNKQEKVTLFLATPLQYGETEVSHVTLPSKHSNEAKVQNLVAENHAVDKYRLVLETFATAIEAMKSRSYESEEEQKEILLSRRSTVQFKIRFAKKSLRTVLCSSPHNKNFQKTYSWFGRENEKDEKKRRAEKILKSSMENSQGLSQL